MNYKNKDLPISERVEDLLSRMTVGEKIGQLNQVHTKVGFEDEVKQQAREGMVGSRILATDAFGGSSNSFELSQVKIINEVQKVAVEESRLGIPLINGRDVIHGHRTVFPVPLAQAASWEPELVRRGCEIAAAEASACGVHWTFAPMMDVARDPRWGRIIEGSGEDPYLTGQMAAAAVRGFQGENMEDQDRIAACAKHFIAYGGAEGGRDYNTTECSENTLRNTYLPPFKAAVEAGVATVMSGFHEVGGEPVSGSHKFLTKLLKNELGFKGFVISDWGSVTQLEAHGVAEGEKDAVKISINAGVDMDMADGGFVSNATQLVNEGKISRERLDDAVRRVLTVKFQVGLFETPYVDTTRFDKVMLNPSHLAFAREFAAQTMVLLKNENKILPLIASADTTVDSAAATTETAAKAPRKRKPLKIALIGPMAEVKRQLLGSWTLDGKSEEVVSIAEGLRAVAEELKTVTLDARAGTTEATTEAAIDGIAEMVVVSNMTDEMLLAARKADVVIIALGESDRSSGESSNVTSLSLPVGQEELVEAVSRLGKPIISLICAGRPYSIGRIAELSEAVLYAWHPGTQAGLAIADILFGKVNPSAKLPVTIPQGVGQVPLYYNHKNMGHSFDEYYSVGDREHYIDDLGSPLYPFGFGLSYTQFEYSDLEVVEVASEESKSSNEESKSSNEKSEFSVNFKVKVKVKNIGDVPGQEVVQCYIRDKVASQTRPAKELKGFEKIYLEPGESKRVEFLLGKNELSFYDVNNEFTLEPGTFMCGVGGNCLVELKAEFEVPFSTIDLLS